MFVCPGLLAQCSYFIKYDKLQLQDRHRPVVAHMSRVRFQLHGREHECQPWLLHHSHEFMSCRAPEPKQGAYPLPWALKVTAHLVSPALLTARLFQPSAAATPGQHVLCLLPLWFSRAQHQENAAAR